jgi:hypothetical protein
MLQIPDKARSKLRCSIALRPQYGGRMIGSQDSRAARMLQFLTARALNRHRRAGERAQSRGAERNYDQRLHAVNLAFQPDMTGIDLAGGRPFMEPPFAPRFPLEVLDRVGDEQIFSLKSSRRNRLFQHATRGTSERMTANVLLVARLFAYQHDFRSNRAFTLDNLGRVFP